MAEARRTFYEPAAVFVRDGHVPAVGAAARAYELIANGDRDELHRGSIAAGY